MSTARVPPHDLKAEQELLGSCMLDRECARSLVGVLQGHHFYKPAYGLVWQAVQACEADGVVADLLQVRTRLEASGELQRVGGDELLIGLTDTIPTLANAEALGRRVRGLAAARAVQRAAYDVLKEGYEPIEDIPDFLARAERHIVAAASSLGDDKEFISLAQAARMADSRLQARLSGAVAEGAPVPTGLQRVDALLGGGAWPGTLIVVAGRPGMGKTAYALQLARNAGQRAPVAFFSLEMPAEQLGERAMASDAGVDSTLIRSGRLSSEQKAALAAADALRDETVWIDDTASVTVADIRRKATRFARKHGLSLVAVDYMQLMKAVRKSGSREEDVAEISRTLKIIAKELNVPVVALAQLNRKCEERTDKRPQLSDLRESGAIEQDADVVIFLYRDEVYNANTADKGIAEIAISKHRQGSTGVARVAYRKELTLFANLESWQ